MYVFDKALRNSGYETKYIVSDFHHIKKQTFKCNVDNSHQIHVRPYAKNLSVDRILSHRDFAKGVYNYLSNLKEEPDIIVCDVPPNFLVKYISKYKKQHSNVRVVFDLFDLWPETFPSNKVKKLLAPIFSIWANLRNNNLSSADLITTECNLYRQVLKKQLEGLNTQTIYLCKSDNNYNENKVNLSDDVVELCYLGSINNVTDIDKITKLVAEITCLKKVNFNIIGDGENKDTFVQKLNDVSANVLFHGKIYEDEQKQRIFDRCHFGINVMKSSVCIGLTMKSIDYFSAGLPILNNVSADTTNLVAENNMGININSEDLAETARKVANCTAEENLIMRKNVAKIFEEKLCESVILEEIESAIKDL